MSATYKATGINLKAMPLGESDRLLTILTREYGLIRVVAPGARKTRSSLGGRSGLFVVNELLIAPGRSLHKLSQAEMLTSYTGLSKHLSTLTASQYLAELVIYQALSEQPQVELFDLLCYYLSWLEQSPEQEVLAVLSRAVFHLLEWAGIAPQVQQCCLTRRPITPDYTDPDWRIGFSYRAGGTVTSPVEALSLPAAELQSTPAVPSRSTPALEHPHVYLTAIELEVLQYLSTSLPSSPPVSWSDLPPPSHYPTWVWLAIERTLRQYIQSYLDRPIRSAVLMDACFSPLSSAFS